MFKKRPKKKNKVTRRREDKDKHKVVLRRMIRKSRGRSQQRTKDS